MEDFFPNKPLVVVSNREPYIHNRVNGQIQAMRPAGGAANAVDSVVRACGGIWFAHGSGDADREVVDKNDCVQVPEENPEYTLKRIWLTQEEVKGYYYGFANKALWPLCHLAYAKPSFEEKEWHMYQKVNRKFADAILKYLDGRDAFVWIQDYHFALLPRYLREANPNLSIAQFWHIPWPSPEQFRICPKGEEILQGLLGNDLMGFHIVYHCNNFIHTVNSVLESRVDWEKNTMIFQGKETLVRAFPISVDFEAISGDTDKEDVVNLSKEMKKEYRLDCPNIVFGVDRIDYSKGIPERLMAIDRFLESHPTFKEKVIFVVAGAPSRMKLAIYRNVNREIDRLVEEVNQKHKTKSWCPVIFIRRTLTRKEILAFYRLANVCIVSPLHDGMNIVAKEYVSAKNDLNGVLILSKFTGVAREYKRALQINPFDVDQFANSIKVALEMDEKEKHSRMRELRKITRSNNVYHWALSIMQQLVTL